MPLSPPDPSRSSTVDLARMEMPGVDGLTASERALYVRARSALAIMVGGEDRQALLNALETVARLRRRGFGDLLRDVQAEATGGA